MKKTVYFIASLVLMLSVFSCEKAETAIPVPNENVHAVSVELDRIDDSKVTISGTSITWKEGDAVSIRYKKSGSYYVEKFTLVSGAGNRSGKFVNTASSIDSDCSEIQAFYPYSTLDSDGKLVWDLSSQDGSFENVCNSFGLYDPYNFSYSDGKLSGSKDMYNWTSIIKIAKGIEFPGLSSKTGSATIVLSGGQIASQYKSDYSSTAGEITVSGASVTGGKLDDDVYIVIKPRSGESSVTLKVTVDGLSKTYSLSRSFTSGRIVTLSSMPAIKLEYKTVESEYWYGVPTSGINRYPGYTLNLRAAATDGSPTTYTFSSSDDSQIAVTSDGAVTFKGAVVTPSSANHYSIVWAEADITVTGSDSSVNVYHFTSNIYYKWYVLGYWKDFNIDRSFSVGDNTGYQIGYKDDFSSGIMMLYYNSPGVTYASTDPAVVTWGGTTNTVVAIAAGTCKLQATVGGVTLTLANVTVN